MHHPTIHENDQQNALKKNINDDYKLYLLFQNAFKFAVVQFTSVMPPVELGSLFINF